MAVPAPTLVITYRRGKPWVAYYHLPHEGARRSHDSRLVEPGLVVDYGPDGLPIGIEITAPAQVERQQLNGLLEELGQEPITPQEFEPLHAA